MNLPGKLVASLMGSCVIYAVGVEVSQTAPSAAVPFGVARVSFADLGRALPADPERARAGDYLKAVPRAVLGRDQQRVLLQGFMIPTRVEDKGVREFLLVRNQASCCFGFPLQVTDMVVVRMTGRPAASLMDHTLAVVGRLHVQEHWSGACLGSLYQLDGESVTTESPALPLAAPARGLE
jgi:hypothetical protein